MRFSVRVPPSRPPTEIGAFLQRAERAGFHRAWLTDSQLQWRDVWVSLAFVAARTTSIRLATGVTNPITRHESVTAGAARSLNELSGGRFDLGLGAGESAVRSVGLRPATLEQLRAFLVRIRPLLAGDGHAGVAFSSASHSFTARVPVYVAAKGPRTVQLGGEFADGLLLDLPATTKSINFAMERMSHGARHRVGGLDPPDIVLVMFAPGGEGAIEHRTRARPHAAVRALTKRGLVSGGAVKLSDLARLTHERDLDRIERETAWLPEDEIDEFLAERCLPSSAHSLSNMVARIAATGVEEICVRSFDAHALPDGVCRTLAPALLPSGLIPDAQEDSRRKGALS